MTIIVLRTYTVLEVSLALLRLPRAGGQLVGPDGQMLHVSR